MTNEREGFRVTLYGGAETVTGSHFLVQNNTTNVVIDCGIEQGKDVCDECAYDPFPYDVARIDALIITHAHLDHIGRAPRLMRFGFSGRIYMTAPTRDLGELILRDSAHILKDHARQKGREPLYVEKDIDAFLERVTVVPYHTETKISDTLSFSLSNTGHILGSAAVRIHDHESDATFAVTSDIGATPAVLLPSAEPVQDADVVLIESVYGNRANAEQKHRVDSLRSLLQKAVARGGPVLIPSFSMERTQLILYELAHFFAQKELPEVKVFLDSPLAIAITEVYRKYAREYFNDELKQELTAGKDVFSFPFLTVTESKEDSKMIVEAPNPKVIIAGAGMSHGGRIGNHEVRYLDDSTATLIMVGYQAPGSPGRLLESGVKRIRINGQEVEVRADIQTLHGWSGHADRDGLLAYAEGCLPRTKTFIVGIGEPASSRFLAQRINGFLGVKAIVPTTGETYSITKKGIV